MNAIVPLNVVALRVNANDQSTLVSQFKGASGSFRTMPWTGGITNQANTGDHIIQPLESNFGPQNPLPVGVHLHFELPDYFRRGVQSPEFGANIQFPQTPNRFLVIRYLSLYNGTDYQPPTAKCWLVESDYVTSLPKPDPDGVSRPLISVPLPLNPCLGQQPYSFMGRVVDYNTWNPGTEPASDYLPHYQGLDSQSLYLTSIGFVGPQFSSYYPECISVFGFWDSFADQPTLLQQIKSNASLQFKVSYQVIGWIQGGADPLTGLTAEVTTNYNNYVAQCAQQNVPVTRTPADFFVSLAQQRFHWLFQAVDIPFTLNQPSQTLASITLPQATLCSGISQEIVWDMLTNPAYQFLGTGQPLSPAVWQDTVELAAGNTTVEALSALLKTDVGNHGNDPDVLRNYEYLLDALQLNMLHGMEKEPNKLITLDEQLHSRQFTKVTGGTLWIVEQTTQDPNQPPQPDNEITLPLPLAEQLNLLNLAQKAYDQARAAVEAMRRQLFLDWFRYIKIDIGETPDPNIDFNQLSGFLFSNGPCELASVIAQGDATGILLYQQNSSGQITGLQQPASTTSLAGQVYAQYQTVLAALPQGWQLANVPAPAFFQPTDPTLLIEGSMLEPVRRNGTRSDIAVRLTSELLGALSIGYSGSSFTVDATSLAGLPTITAVTPMQSDVQALVNEAGLLIPTLAPWVASALQTQGGANNPAVGNYADFVASLQSAQGGLSPLAGGPGAGLFLAIRQANYIAGANPMETVTTPLSLTVTFTNSANNGWAPDAVGWTAQTALPAFSATRVDPFLPVSLIWTFNFFPLVRNNGDNYTADNLVRYFDLDTNAVDYQYLMASGVPAPFAASTYVTYTGSVVLSKRPVFSLSSQIDLYLKNYPGDPAANKLKLVRDAYNSRHILSQALSGFNVEQILSAYVPPVPVQDLLNYPSQDAVTCNIAAAAKATTNDNWYSFGFNNQQPIATGSLAQANFGPLRSGFIQVQSLAVVDVFGQLMTLNTGGGTAGLTTIPAFTLAPQPGDTAHQSLLYLAPRLLTPTRLWFRWLSATFTPQIPGITADFVEMNSHPSTSPVCGWVLPNHLDNSLFFYDANGQPIGSFGSEHGANVYRTRAGNRANPGNSLALDIGPQGSPTVNPSLANFMWFVDSQSNGFLEDLMTTILNSDMFIHPDGAAQDAALAVLIGRPLALTRAVLSMETLGGVLPVSQADVSPQSAFPADVAAGRFEYAQRQVTSTASLSSVQFPVRLGNLADLDDGLVGFLIEAPGPAPYSTVFSPAAPTAGANHVVQPTATTLQLTPNQAPIVLTLLVDPRAGVHATTGVLPVSELTIPPDQYLQTMQSLAMTFFTSPVLQAGTGLTVPLPQESGYDWEWIYANGTPARTLKANAATDVAMYGYTPQTLLEGWLDLTPAPVAPSVTDQDEQS